MQSYLANQLASKAGAISKVNPRARALALAAALKGGQQPAQQGR
jgi:hypothetical protein